MPAYDHAMAERTLHPHQNAVIDRRTLATDFRALAALLRPGMRVLDCGCGAAAMTIGMAEAVGPRGYALGVDHNPHFIERARELYAGQPNLEFRLSPLEALDDVDHFDVVAAARTLQWMPKAVEALHAMVRAAKPGGLVVVLDYNHARIRWEPEPPASMRRFMDAWLGWRAAEGMDNEIADHLPAMFEAAGLEDIRLEPQHEPVRKPDRLFAREAAIWANMTDVHGPSAITAGLLTEDERLKAGREFRDWIAGPGQFQEMYLLACIGRKPS